MNLRPAAFLDRDGVINLDRGYVYRADDFEFVEGIFEGAAALKRLGFALVVITNQSGVGRGLFSESDLQTLNRWMISQFAQRSIGIEAVFYCPHHPTEALGCYRRECDCRKPGAGLLIRAGHEFGLDLTQSAMFGDRASDLQAAAAAGVPLRYLLGTDGLLRPPPIGTSGLSLAEFRNLREAATSVELIDAVNALAAIR